MLKARTSFPQVGSYALRTHDNVTALVRIQARQTVGGDDYALISCPGVAGSSGNATVPVADLIDGTPLDDAELAEMRRLDRDRADGKLRRKARARLAALSQRRIYARLLDTLMINAGLATRTLNTESVAA